ncbi:putative gamma-butyrobetaine dioxygenase [Phaeomoniella chlamydospora]|uniref:Putative gamma-butyrobetaine dioxygenase n=1 Tax=Phaeomoniella chlamydospora TaxID=158046 RepID=A0A0G2EW93_PHACM|nr:putative gamma-butyrobetaine dioxygenase [Phaeomoniella chlamydospora]
MGPLKHALRRSFVPVQNPALGGSKQLGEPLILPLRSAISRIPIRRYVATEAVNQTETPAESTSLKNEEPTAVSRSKSRRREEQWIKDLLRRTDSKTPLKGIIPFLDPIRIRDACQCEICVDSSTKQRKFLTSQIPVDINFGHIEYIQPHQARFTWQNDIPGYPVSHRTEYSTQDVLQSFKPHASMHKWRQQRILWDTKQYVGDKDNWVDYRGFLQSDEVFKQALTNLSRYGLIFITGIPTTVDHGTPSEEEINAVSNIATRIGPLYNSHYGSTWDVRSVAQAKNVAYTNVDLGFHMDLLYKKEPPYIQLLHCLRNSQSGGESLFVDTFRAAVELYHTRDGPKHWHNLITEKLRYHYHNDNQSFVKAWSPFRAVRPNPSSTRSNRRLPPMLTEVYYSPPFQGPLHPISTDSRKQVKALRAFGTQLQRDDLMYETKMEPGMCVIFENLRYKQYPMSSFLPPIFPPHTKPSRSLPFQLS